jgi:outer membrane lipoprotein
MKRTLPLFAAVLLAGCVTTPEALRGEYSAIEPGQAARTDSTGQRVRWGGRVVSVEPRAESTCFEIVGVRLGSDGRPLAKDQSSGRFLACRGGFYDPEIFKAGREVTLSGVIDGHEDRKVGEYDYRYPRMAADVVFLWPERRDVDVIVERGPYWW